MMRENHAFRFNFTGFLLVSNFPQIRTRELGPDGWVGSDSDRRPTSAQFLKAFEDEHFATVCLRRRLVILQVFTVTAGAFEPN